jgi:hypothetical protein
MTQQKLLMLSPNPLIRGGRITWLGPDSSDVLLGSCNIFFEMTYHNIGMHNTLAQSLE